MIRANCPHFGENNHCYESDDDERAYKIPEIKLSHEVDASEDDDAPDNKMYTIETNCTSLNNSPNVNNISDVSSDCSNLSDIELEQKDVDIAFAEDFNSEYVHPTTFEIDLNDDEPSCSSPTSCRNSEMREKLVLRQAKPIQNLSLKYSGMIKSHSSPSLLEVGCFGFRSDDYYRNCAQIVAEARQREKMKDFRGANELLKAAVEILIAGVQHDTDPMRREGVRRRTAEYLQIADNFAVQHQRQKLSKKPTIISLDEIRKYRVLSVQDKVMIVESPNSGMVRVLKSLRKPLNSVVAGQALVVRCPFMVHLERCCVSQDTVFLLLKRVQGYELQDYVKRFENSTPLPPTLSVGSYSSKEHSPVSYNPDPLELYRPCDEPSNLCVPKNVKKIGVAPSNLVAKWAAQLVVCLSSLHKQGLVYADLHHRNILIDDFSNACVTYITQLPGLHHRVSPRAISDMCVAPEVLSGLHTVTPAADWWSLGAILYYLFTGTPLSHHYPYQAIRSTNIRLTTEAQSGGSSLLAGLLKYNPVERLGGGVMGAEEIRSHSYFSNINWGNLEKKLCRTMI